MLMNKFSGRSFNDMTQYPIFPWVLNDYKSNPEVFYESWKKQQCYRDLSAHSGILSDKKLAISKDIYEDSKSDIDEPTNIMTYGRGAFHMKFGCSS